MRTLAAGLVVFLVSMIARSDGAQADPPAVGLRLVFAGKLAASDADNDAGSAQTFRLTFVVTEATAGGGCRAVWVIEDQGSGPRIGWPQRFGLVTLNQSMQPTSDRDLPAIEGERDGMRRSIVLRPPFFAGVERLKPGGAWEEAGSEYDVIGREDVAGRKAWRVAVSNNRGLRSLLWIDDKERLVARRVDQVFLGQGVPHELSLELAKAETLGADAAARHAQAHAKLSELRGPANQNQANTSEPGPAATPEQLARAKAAQAEIGESLKEGVYADLARDSVREIQTALNRQSSLGKMRDAIVGKPAKPVTLTAARGGKINTEEFKGKPVVLHFWEYRSEPKEAPYGETGYLDFLWRQGEKAGIRVIGVAVDERLRDESTRAAARKDVRAFCDFMNLSFPVGFDESNLIETFGDPRRVGAKLPLYVVIAPDGTVAEYHAGLWGSTPDEGLRDLDQRLRKLLK